MPHVAWTPKSRMDLRDIRGYIRISAPHRSGPFVRRLMASTARLKKHPLLGEVVHELHRADVREILHGNYRIVYRVTERRVDILREIHAARLLNEGMIE